MRLRRACRLGLALAGLLALVTVLGGAFAEQARAAVRAPEAPLHNYILIIDNSMSTTGRHSLGSATDPKGLRFDAARLVYENVTSAAATGAKGELGVIVFCGPDNCVSYGPLDIGDPAAESRIGDKLNEAANAARRDVYTDIRTALETAKAMQSGFEGNTSVILLTDGVNDLTNRSDPLSRPENIEANQRSVALAGELREAGADFHVIALATETDLSKLQGMMSFINEMAEAGGGEWQSDGTLDNVLMATQADLNSALVQMLVKAESASDVQTIVEYTPVDAPFTVPYSGITDATVNITFMPEDKPLLERVELVDPEGERYVLWEGGEAREQAGITVTEERSYIMLGVPEPKAGDWNVVVTSRKTGEEDSRVLINAVVRFNHNLRLSAELDGIVPSGELMRVSVWFQRYNGETFEDLTDSDIYRQSQATLTMLTPEGKGRTAVMKLEGDRYTIGFRPKQEGVWTARIRVRNPYVQETSDDLTFEVTAPLATPEPVPDATPEPTSEPTPEPAPTPEPILLVDATAEPTPEPTPVPTVVPVEDIDVAMASVTTGADGNSYLLQGNGAVVAAWKVTGETDYVEGSLLEDGEVILEGIQSGDSLDRGLFKSGASYQLRVEAMPKNGTLVDAEPQAEVLSFELAPPVSPVRDIQLSVEPVVEALEDVVIVDGNGERVTFSWSIEGETDWVEASLLKDGETLRQGLESGGGVERALFEADTDYELRVDAMSKNAAIYNVKPVSKSLTFRVNPPCEPMEGLSLTANGAIDEDGAYAQKSNRVELAWSYDAGVPERFELMVSDANGNAVVSERLGGGSTSYGFEVKEKGDYAVTLTAVPRYAPSEEVYSRAGVIVRPHIATFIERYWYFIAGGAVLLAAAIIALLLVRSAKAPRVSGMLRVQCEALELNARLTFVDDRKGVKLNAPLTAHPTIAKLKGKKVYEVLGNVRVNVCRTDGQGNLPAGLPPEKRSEDAPLRRPNERLISLTTTDPATKASRACYVGRYDTELSTLTVEQGGTAYQLEFGPR